MNDLKERLNGRTSFLDSDKPELLVIGEKENTAAMHMPSNNANHSHLIFTDDSHNSRTLQALNMMRKNRNFCDVVLLVGSSEIYGHRAILAASSPYLYQLFNVEEEKKGNIRESVMSYKLNGGFDKKSLEILIEYMYTGSLEVDDSMVKNIYLVATQLKMGKVAKKCIEYLIENLNVENCIDIRSLPGISNARTFLDRINQFISSKFEMLMKSSSFLCLPCFKIEVLSQSRQEMELVNPTALLRLAIQWIKRQEDFKIENFVEKLAFQTHLLYLALDNTLQDCSDLPSSDLSDSEIVQDYKKMSKKHGAVSSTGTKRKVPLQPAGPRVLILGENGANGQEEDPDWDLIAFNRVGVELFSEYAFLALTIVSNRLSRLSVSMKLNPSPITTPEGSRPVSQGPDTYQMVAHMTDVKCAAGCANFNETLLVCGGYDRGECLKCVESYDPITNLWAALAPLKEARGRFNIAVVLGNVYAVGGSNGSTELCTVEKYDPEEHKWTRVSNLPIARSNAGVCGLNDKLYCVGGWNGQVGMKQCEMYDPLKDTWVTIAPLKIGRSQAGVCAFENRLVAVGGCDAWNCLSSMEVYDPVRNVWETGPSMTTNRRGCGMAVFKGKLYVVGGSDGTHSLSTTEIFDWAEQTWTPGPNMTTPRANVGVAVIGNRLYAVGGFSGKTFLNSIEYLDESTNEWTTFVPKLAEDSQQITNALYPVNIHKKKP
ncbi:UNVERIFIED_CONTAM: hypothetical protein PYX00_007832 [Menopon gallinae]|uniref:BTB domain-containing protein n=1 Tax=Menopon gallinae TaxID=328185 RepID=A0AAW2HKS6_9NEOP